VRYGEVEQPGQFSAGPIQRVQLRAAAGVFPAHLLDDHFGIRKHVQRSGAESQGAVQRFQKRVSIGRTTGNPDTYTYTDVNGGNQTYTVSYSSQHIKTIFGCSGNPYDIDKPGIYLPSSVTLPTGAQYGITYEATPGFPADVTGRIGKVTLPAGGYVSFAYSGGHGGGLNGFDCNYQTIPQFQITVNDNNGHTNTTTYVHGYTSGATVTETDSLGNVTTHNFTSAVETQRVVSDVSRGQLGKTITYCGSCGAGGTQPITQTDVYTYPGTSTSPSLVETKFDTYGDPTEISRWDFGATYPPTGNPVSKTTYTYDTPRLLGGAPDENRFTMSRTGEMGVRLSPCLKSKKRFRST
jgi:hypothetical protein